jgi:ATP-binding cassette, subfamily B, bacterial
MDDLSRYAQRPFGFYLRYVRLRPIQHAGILLAGFAAAICAVGTQYGLKFLVDALSGTAGRQGEAWFAFGLLISLLAADHLLSRVGGVIASVTFPRVTADLRSDIFRHVMGHSPSYFADRLPGTLTSRITATSNAVMALENMFAWNVLPPIVGNIGAFVILAAVTPTVTAGLGLVALGMILVIFRLAAAAKPLHRVFATKAAAVDGELVDVIGNMAIVRAFGGIRRESARIRDALDREAVARRQSLLYMDRLRIFHSILLVAMMIGLLAWAIILWQRGEATTGDVVLVCTLGFSILQATRELAYAFVDVSQHMARLAEAIGTLLLPQEIRDLPDATPLAGRRGSIVFDHVNFVYPGGTKVFDDFNLSIEAGQRIGLVGESGGGKSTVFALLQRFYDVDAGRILIDGQEIAYVSQESLREVIGTVPQDTSLFHRSIMENIRYGQPDASDEEVLAAASAAHCLGFIDGMPEGFATLVGERGVKLSGGQRQRIAIARAFLKNAPIVLLDEATSALDIESEEAIREALDRLIRGRTVIAIAHRLSTLRGFDRILVLELGRIIEDGPPDLLMGRAGPYRKLIDRELARLPRRPAAGGAG